MKHYDEYVNKVLQEACFGNSHEKLTGIKRQVGYVNEADNETQERKAETIEVATMAAIEMYNDRQEQRKPMDKKEFGEMAIQVLQHFNASKDYGAMGDEITLADWKTYFQSLANGQNEHSFTPEWIRVMLKKVMSKVRKEVELRMKHGGHGDEEAKTGEQSVVAKHGMRPGEMERLRGSGMIS